MTKSTETARHSSFDATKIEYIFNLPLDEVKIIDTYTMEIAGDIYIISGRFWDTMKNALSRYGITKGLFNLFSPEKLSTGKRLNILIFHDEVELDPVCINRSIDHHT